MSPVQAEDRRERLTEIERVLKFDANHPDKKQLIREYLALTEPEAVQIEQGEAA